MVAANFVTKKEGLYLGIDQVISATELAILAFLRKQHSRLPGFRPPRFSDQQLLELSEYAARVPFWKDNQAAQETIRRLKCDPDFLAETPAFPAAIKGIQSLASHIEILGYVTTRPVSLFETTQAYLNKFDLPGAELFMGPDTENVAAREQDRNSFLDIHLRRPRGIIEADASLVDSLNPPEDKGVLFLLRNPKTADRASFIRNLVVPKFAIFADGWKEVVKQVRIWSG